MRRRASLFGTCPVCGSSRILTHCDARALRLKRNLPSTASCGWLHCLRCVVDFHPITGRWTMPSLQEEFAGAV